MSRTPVRQALPVLAQEGLLAEHETRGYIVRGFSTADIFDALDVRGVLEGLAARRVAEQGASRTLIAALRHVLADGDRIFGKGRLEESDEALYADMNGRFHSLIVREARSAMIEQAIDRNGRIPLRDRSAGIRQDQPRLHVPEAHIFASAASLHRRCLENGEGSRVEALMREHVNPVKRASTYRSAGAHRSSSAALSLVR